MTLNSKRKKKLQIMKDQLDRKAFFSSSRSVSITLSSCCMYYISLKTSWVILRCTGCLRIDPPIVCCCTGLFLCVEVLVGAILHHGLEYVGTLKHNECFENSRKSVEVRDFLDLLIESEDES